MELPNTIYRSRVLALFITGGLALMSMGPSGCTFDVPAGGTCEVEGARQNGYVCQNGEWRPIPPDTSSGPNRSSDVSPSTPDTSDESAPPDTPPDTSRPSRRDTGTVSSDDTRPPERDTRTSDTSSTASDSGTPACQDNDDCPDGTCRNGQCRAPSCNDGVLNGDETDVDCGGPQCRGCNPDQSCRLDRDCASAKGVCTNGTCELQECQDGETRPTPSTQKQSCGYKGRGTPYDVCENGSWTIGAQCRDVWYTSCREYLEANPNAGRGRYTLDPGGPGTPPGADMYLCSKRGWTRVAFEPFTNGASGWSDTRTSTCGAYGRILGGYDIFGRMRISKQFQFPPIPHGQIRARLRYIAIDDWEAQGPQQDLAGIRLGSSPGTGARFSGRRGTQECGRRGQSRLESDTQLETTIQSSSNSVQLFVGARTTAGADNEAWGIDNVAIWVK